MTQAFNANVTIMTFQNEPTSLKGHSKNDRWLFYGLRSFRLTCQRQVSPCDSSAFWASRQSPAVSRDLPRSSIEAWLATQSKKYQGIYLATSFLKSCFMEQEVVSGAKKEQVSFLLVLIGIPLFRIKAKIVMFHFMAWIKPRMLDLLEIVLTKQNRLDKTHFRPRPNYFWRWEDAVWRTLSGSVS